MTDFSDDVGSWLGIVDPQADDEACQNFRNSADAWISTIEDSDDDDDGDDAGVSLILATLSIAAGGVVVSQNSYDTEVESLFTHISETRTLRGNAKSNDLCLQVFCLMVLKLILETEDAKFEKLVAETLISSLHIRTAKAKPKLQKIFEICLKDSWKKIDALGSSKRKIPSLENSFSKVSALTLSDPGGTKTLSEILQGFGELVVQARSVDREELNILWWMVNGFSDKANQSFRKLPVCAGILACALELAAIGIDPPASFVRNLLKRQVTEWYRDKDVEKISMEELVTGCADFDFEAFLPENHAVIQNHAHMFPIHWVLLRLHNSDAKGDWQKEYEKKSTLNSKDKVSMESWSVQAFQERVALNLWMSEYGS